MTAPDPAARTALLERLTRDGFVPPDGTATWSAAARCAAFAAEVEAFAVAFWSLAPAGRRQRYETLWETRYGPAAARLAELEPGLDMVPVPQPDPVGEEVEQLIRDLFVLHPRDRTACRATWAAAAAAEAEPQKPSVADRAAVAVVGPVAGLERGLLGVLREGVRLTPFTPVPDPDAVRRGVEAFRTTLAEHKEAERHERREQLIKLYGGYLALFSVPAIVCVLIVAWLLQSGCPRADRTRFSAPAGAAAPEPLSWESWTRLGHSRTRPTAFHW
ncbi:MAG TPA: hypothetical protein VH092_08300 [Urbifossiella sp.]|jgi:hypothetical protein|nr:hypothetical protein [Urbifossiella sp.]